jgi:predicted transcriptional regulator
MSIRLENPNIRISPHSKATLRELAKREGKPMQAVLDQAVEQYRRETFFRDLNDSYARLQADPEAWKQELAERRQWDSTLLDGLTSDGE